MALWKQEKPYITVGKGDISIQYQYVPVIILLLYTTFSWKEHTRPLHFWNLRQNPGF